MGEIEDSLYSAFRNLSDQNYEQTLAFFCFWFGIGQAYSQISSDQIYNMIWDNRGSNLSAIEPRSGKLFHPTAHLILRFASDAESNDTLAPYSTGLQGRLCVRILRSFFEMNVEAARGRDAQWGGCYLDGYDRPFAVDSNLIAQWANSGKLEEVAIRSHILQSLVSHHKLYDHQADAIIILFKTAGATFGAYADPSVVDRCFELLKDHYSQNSTKGRLVQVCVRAVKGGYRADQDDQEVRELRERRWEGLPPPPVFKTAKPKPIGRVQEGLCTTPVTTLLGLPNIDLEPHLRPVEPVTTTEAEAVPGSPVPQSPSISISTLSDLTTAADTSDAEFSVDPTAINTHDTFYLEDGNVEVLCENTLFRVHTSVLSFHSPSLRRVFSQTGLASAESPNGCPRILSSDTTVDFTTLLKIVYLPEYRVSLQCCRVVPLIIRLQIP